MNIQDLQLLGALALVVTLTHPRVYRTLLAAEQVTAASRPQRRRGPISVPFRRYSR